MNEMLENTLKIVIKLLWMFLPMVIFIFALKRTINKARKENMSRIDFAKEKDYYRDILKGFSPAELSYIDDFKIKTTREIVATILNLKLKGKIDINNGKINVIDSGLQGLRKTEKFILENIKDGKVKIHHSGYFQSYAKDEAIEDNLIKKTDKEIIKKRTKKKALKLITTVVVIVIIISVIFLILGSNVEIRNNIIEPLLALLLVGLLTFFPSLVKILLIVTVIYLLMQINSYSRTEEGEELNKKIEGLKQYIMEYGSLNKTEQEALMLWDEYLIYSVIFDINSTIVEELSHLIEIEFESGKIYYIKNNKKI